MEFIFIIIFTVLIIILFDKITKLKRQVDYQESKIRKLQEQVNLKEKSGDITVPKVEPAQPIADYKIDYLKPSAEKIQQKEKVSTSVYQKTEKKVEQSVNSTTLFIKDNFLTIVGIVTLVLGIGYFVKYAIDQNWINETFRVLIGVVIGLSIIGIAHRIRKSFEVFSSILIGGGISILYFTLTIAFREYHIFSQDITFILLTVVTLLSIVLGLIYNKQVVAIFSIIGGFSAPLMISTGESNFIFLFSYLVLLNLGMLYMAWRKNWQAISFIAFAFSFAYSLAWIIDIKTQMQALFFIIFYFIYQATSLFNYFYKKEFTAWNCLLMIFNTITTTVFITLALQLQHTGLISIFFGILNLLFALYIYRTTQHKILQNTLIALCIALITTAIALEFKANYVAISFAIESTLLLFLWKKSHENIFKVFFICLFPFLLVALCVNWFAYYETAQHLNIIFNPVFITSFVVAICSLFNIYLMQDFETEERFLGFKLANSKFIFILTSILFIYSGVVLELIYQIEPYFHIPMIISFVFIYTLFFVATILLIRNILKLSNSLVVILQICAAICLFFLPMIANIPNEVLEKEIKSSTYLIYLTYLIPSGYILYLVIKDTDFKKYFAPQIAVLAAIVYIISFEKYNVFMLLTLNDLGTNFIHQQDIFRLILLPVIWAISGFIIIYFGLRKQLKAFPIIGIILFALIILKLYLIDVWEMSNVFRIVSFIVLGVLILITSFMYQKLKNLMLNLMDNPSEKTEAES